MSDGIAMNFDLVGTVFECVGDAQCFVRELTFLTNGDEPGAESIGECAA